jgi:hypothetical protein
MLTVMTCSQKLTMPIWGGTVPSPRGNATLSSPASFYFWLRLLFTLNKWVATVMQAGHHPANIHTI